jgi:hypothetical protein
MTYTFLRDMILFPFGLIALKPWKFLNFETRGHWPGLFMVLKFFRDAPQEVNNEGTLCFLEYDQLKIIQKETSYFHGQEIFANEDFEKGLLSLSGLNWFPHEVMQVRIINSEKEMIASKPRHGGQFKAANIDELKHTIRHLVLKARKQGLTIEEIEIAHTHPSLEVMVENGSDANFVFNGLSAADRRVGSDVSQHQHFPIRVKAITPAANYSRVF